MKTNNNNVLFIIDSLNSGGAQRQVVNTSIGLKRKGYNPQIIITHDLRTLEKELIAEGINIIGIHEKNKLFLIFRVLIFINNFNPKCLITFLDGSNFLGIIAKFVLINRNFVLISSERTGIKKLNYLTRLKLNIYLISDFIVVNSFRNKTVVENALLFNRKKVKLIYNSINDSFYEFKHLIGCVDNSDVFNIIVLSNYRKEKNLLKILNLIKDYPNRSKIKINWFGENFFINGSPTIESQNYMDSKRFIERYDLEQYITLNSHTFNIQEELVKSKALLLASEYEGFPNAVCEAVTMGKPILSTDVSDVSMWIKSGLNGYIFDIDNKSTFFAGLDFLIGLKRLDFDNIAEFNKKIGDEKFNFNRNIEKFVNLIESNV